VSAVAVSATVTPLHPAIKPGDRILRRPEVEDRVGLSRSTIYRHMHLGKFPPAVDLGGGAVGWRESAIDRYVALRPVRPAFR